MALMAVTLVLLAAMPVVAVALPSVDALTAHYKNYPYVRIIEVGDTATLTDEEFFSIAAKVVFPVNKYQLPTGSELLRELDSEVLPMMNRDSMQVVCMMVRGAASPEGPYEFNRFLGQQRSKSLMNFINDRLDHPADPGTFRLEVEFEDYRHLCLMMRQAGDPDYERVRLLCEELLPLGLSEKEQPAHNAMLKKRLRTMDGGRLWRRLLREYFPQLRAASIVIFVQSIAKKKIEAVPPVALPDTVAVQPPLPQVVCPPVLPEVLSPVERDPRRELLSVKTNLLFDFAYMPGYNRWCPIPNVAIEYYPTRGHFTYGASFDCPWWQHYDDHKYFQVRNYQVETRYYLRSGSIINNPLGEGAAFRGLYFSAYAHAGLFCLSFDADRGWIGEGAGAGIGLGYVLPLSKKGHWRLEFAAQAGFFRCKYDPFQYEYRGPNAPHDHLYYYDWVLSPDLFKKRQYRFNWFGPTRVGITLSYDLLYRRNHRSGLSFISTERRTAP